MRVPVFCLIVFTFSALIPEPVFSKEPKGLIIYKQFADSPDSSTKIEEFDDRIQKASNSTSFYPVGSRRQRLVPQDQILFLIEYPDAGQAGEFKESDLPALRDTAEQMKKAANRFPTATEMLKPHYLEAVQVIKKLGAGLVETLDIAMADGSTKTFKGARILEASSQYIHVSHSTGITTIELSDLADNELVELKIPFLKIPMADGTEKRFVRGKVVGKNFDSLIIHYLSNFGFDIPYEQLSPDLQQKHGFNREEIEKERKRRAAELAAKMAEQQKLLAERAKMSANADAAGAKQAEQGGGKVGGWNNELAVQTYLNNPDEGLQLILKLFSGAWTYTGRGFPTRSGSFRWVRLVIPRNPRDTIFVQQASPTFNSWNEGASYNREFSIESGKYVDTGDRWLGIRLSPITLLLITETGELDYCHTARFQMDLDTGERYDEEYRFTLVRGDVSPFHR